ncbi:MAG: maleylpyruvate isomerase family mycothiol-dependent enzyme [Acidimicrobiia bacterium]|nr:maleylpyruvate isomerase family mycothiol-dependent enzyme [Acidimicrobiia bacterium]
MADINPWTTIHAERRALLGDLEGLSDDDWSTPSLCEGWTVRDVLGHVVATAKKTPPKLVASIVGAGFRFNAMVEKDIAKETEGPPAATLARFRDVIDRTSSPPGPKMSWVGETVVHGEDIRRPLGIRHTYPTDALTAVADFYKGSNLLLGSKQRVAGLRLEATDADWSTGSGPSVSGPMLSLLMALVGRKAALGDLSGDGVAPLQAKM